jgi:hypothetical protein
MSTIACCPPGQEIEAVLILMMNRIHIGQIKADAWVDDHELLIVNDAYRFAMIPPVVVKPPRGSPGCSTSCRGRSSCRPRSCST